MTIRLADLTPLQIKVLATLDDGDPHEDSVGVELESLDIEQLRICTQLRRLGLVEIHAGWSASFWFRLTEAGHRMRASGQ